MALHESMNKPMLEEFGLGTIWVRRGMRAAHVEAGAVPHVVPVTPDEANATMRAASLASLDTATEPPVMQVRAEAEARVAPMVATGASPSNVASVEAEALAPQAEAASFDDFPWLDDPPAARAPIALPDDTDIATLDWDMLAERVASCTRCGLCERRTHAVFGVGDRQADWMLIGEAPGENEDKLGEPFVGPAGKLLDSMLRAVALSREDNVFIANVIKCRPPGNRNPEPQEVARCEPYLKRQVALVKPKLIVALGRFAANSLLNTEASVSSLRGRVHDYEGVPVIVSYHPAYLLRSLPDKAKAWADLCLARKTYRATTNGQ